MLVLQELQDLVPLAAHEQLVLVDGTPVRLVRAQMPVLGTSHALAEEVHEQLVLEEHRSQKVLHDALEEDGQLHHQDGTRC